MRKLNMELNFLLIPVILFASLLLRPTNASNTELQKDYTKQRRLMNRLNSNFGSEISSQDEDSTDDFDFSRRNSELRLWDQFLRTRQRPPVANTEDDLLPGGLRYDVDRDELYELENLFEASGRSTRSKNRHRSSFQTLCPLKRETVFLNLDPQFEYRPEYYEEIRCAHTTVLNDNKIQSAVCTEAGFTCIQLNATIFLTRRLRTQECWETETRVVPSACECMWPKHHLGDITAHH